MSRHDTKSIRRVRAVAFFMIFVAAPSTVLATTYDVGPGQKYVNIGDVRWSGLKAGDTVYIHYRSTPYREKFLISGQGTAENWIRILGVPGPGGELPVISGDGATTSANNHFHWQDATGGSAVQWYGIVHVEISTANLLPSYIEIGHLQIQDAYSAYGFTTEAGVTTKYHDFAACIYARSVQHILVHDTVMANCGLGFFNWTGSGSKWWDGLEVDTVLRRNYFYNNGIAGNFSMHQVYTESDGVTVEFNRFGPMRADARGSQIKDRSAGTVIRYNYIEQSVSGWDLDLVEPQGSSDALLKKNTYKQTFVYGNIIVDNNVTNYPDVVHWNEDTGLGVGRATLADGRLFFYHNTIVIVMNLSDQPAGWVNIFNTTFGAFECPSANSPGTIDVRNNIIAVLPRTVGSAIPQLRWAYCYTNFNFGANWVSPGWIVNSKGSSTGLDKLISPSSNTPGFVNTLGDLHLAAGSQAIGVGARLAPELTINYLGVDLTPNVQYVYHQKVTPRTTSGESSDLGAFAIRLQQDIKYPQGFELSSHNSTQVIQVRPCVHYGFSATRFQ